MTATANSRILLASRSTGLIDALRAEPNSGVCVDVASSGPEVLTALRDQAAFSLVLLDADLPGMNPGELLAVVRARKTDEQFPIVLVREPVAPEWLRSVVRTLACGQDLGPPSEASALDARTDPLTGLYPRGALLSMLFRETDRVQRMKTSLCLMLFGIDDFEVWKARLRIEAWGEFLGQVVERVRRLLRSYDLFGRVGECDFVLGLPGCEVINAIALAERIRLEVSSAPFSVRGVSIRPTLGFGIASSDGRSPVVVLREGERELQNARASGPGSIRVSHHRH